LAEKKKTFEKSNVFLRVMDNRMLLVKLQTD